MSEHRSEAEERNSSSASVGAPMTEHRSDRTPARRADQCSLLEVRSVTKRFEGVLAVDAVDLDVEEGDILGVIGPNGAGKTTLFNCMSGLEVPTSGEIRFRGRALSGRPDRFTRAGVARTFQNIRLFPHMTAFENVLVGRHCRMHVGLGAAIGRGRKFRKEEREAATRADELLDFVGLTRAGDTVARNLSYGDQRRLEIARALASEPSLLILDEPAAGMNHVEAAKLSALIRSLAEDGLTILFIEHNVGMVLETCTRVVVLNFGEVIASGSPDVIAADPAVIEAYLGTEHDEPVSGSIADGTLPDPTGGGSDGTTSGAVTNVDPGAAGMLEPPETTPRNAT